MKQELQIRSRQSLPGPQIFHLIVDITGIIGGNIFDLPQQLPFPCNTFFLESVRQGDEANSLIMYFQKLNLPRAFSFATFSGNEPIYFLTSNRTTGPVYRTVLRFKEPVTNFFVGIGTEDGVGSQYCIGCTNDDEMEIYGGIYT